MSGSPSQQTDDSDTLSYTSEKHYIEDNLETLSIYVDGSKKESDPGRKALHSPSIYGSTLKRPQIARSGSQTSSAEMRKYSENHMAGGGSGSVAGGHTKNSGRKCISRAQMAEPYELSQDLLDRQVEALSNKYGGGLLPHNAANTIQRAYRRYTMDKKFKALTSSRNGKTENRLSRRFASMLSGGDYSSVEGIATTSSVGCHQGRGGDQVDSSSNITITTQQHGHAECCVYNNSIKTPGSHVTVTASSTSLPSQLDSSKSNTTLEQYQLHHQKLQHHYQQQLHAQRKQLEHHHKMQLQQQQQHIMQQQQLHHLDSSSRLVCISGINHHVTTSPGSSPVVVGGGGGVTVHHDCHNYSCSLMHHTQQQQRLQHQVGSAGMKNKSKHNTEDEDTDTITADHSDADINTYTPEYTPDRQSGRQAAEYTPDRQSSRQAAEYTPDRQSSRQATEYTPERQSGRQGGLHPRAVGGHCKVSVARPGHHSHCTNCALQSQQQCIRPIGSRKRAPDVPKRTVSRLTSFDVEESSELYPAAGGSSHSRTCADMIGAASRVCADLHPGRLCTNDLQHQVRVCSPRATAALRDNNTSQDSNNVYNFSSPNSSTSSAAALAKQELNRSLVSSSSSSSAAQTSRDLNRNLHAINQCSAVDSAINSSIGSSRSTTSKDMFNNSNYTVNEVIRKRHYRTGLNIFNKKPEKGISYLITKGFLDNSPAAVARFLITRKGLSKQMIGDYLGNISNSFNMAVLNAFSNEIDLSNSYLDVALRKFQTYFRMPGEAQKIERLMEIFSQRYCVCNPAFVSQLNSMDTIFIMAFAIILLNTDLHTPNLKPEKRMKAEDFIRNLRGIDEGVDPDPVMLNGIYERIKAQEFKPGSDHVTQVMKVQQTIVVKCPNLAVPYRRLVCYCRLYEVQDINKKDKPGQHQREVFLFNDILVITKIYSRRKNSVTYAFRNQFPLTGMIVSLFENCHYAHGITLTQRWDRKVVITLNARNDHDRSKFVEDLRESVAEMDEMEALRIEAELEKQHAGSSRVSVAGSTVTTSASGATDNRDSGVNDCDSQQSSTRSRYGGESGNLKRSAINNSLLDLAENHNTMPYPGFNIHDKPVRRGSVGSLDSGMSVSFQSGSAGSAGTVSQESSPQQQQLIILTARNHHQLTGGAVRQSKQSQNMSTNL